MNGTAPPSTFDRLLRRWWRRGRPTGTSEACPALARAFVPDPTRERGKPTVPRVFRRKRAVRPPAFQILPEPPPRLSSLRPTHRTRRRRRRRRRTEHPATHPTAQQPMPGLVPLHPPRHPPLRRRHLLRARLGPLFTLTQATKMLDRTNLSGSGSSSAPDSPDGPARQTFGLNICPPCRQGFIETVRKAREEIWACSPRWFGLLGPDKGVDVAAV
jgi:hypothetical protein